MKNYSLLVQLIGIVEQLENEHGQEKEISLNDFSDYLMSKKAATPFADEGNPKIKLIPEERTSKVISLEKKKGTENNISRLLLLLTRHARNYAKKAFENTPFQTLEEFSYLAMLYNVPSVTKSELINNNFQEKTSGTEVIRRLLANEVATQFDDKLDKRSKRVMITAKGKKLLESVFRNMGYISELLVHNLSTEERSFLLAILQKLDTYHRAEFPNTKALNMEQLKNYVES